MPRCWWTALCHPCCNTLPCRRWLGLEPDRIHLNWQFYGSSKVLYCQFKWVFCCRKQFMAVLTLYAILGPSFRPTLMMVQDVFFFCPTTRTKVWSCHDHVHCCRCFYSQQNWLRWVSTHNIVQGQEQLSYTKPRWAIWHWLSQTRNPVSSKASQHRSHGCYAKPMLSDTSSTLKIDPIPIISPLLFIYILYNI